MVLVESAINAPNVLNDLY